MSFRKIVSLSIALSFVILLATGILSYYQDYSRAIATLHTTFGFLFAAGVAFHLANNFGPLRNYSRDSSLLFISAGIALLFLGAYAQTEPFRSLMDFGTRLKATAAKELNLSAYEIVEMGMDKEVGLSIDLLRSEHYWHPQMAVWTEDTLGNYLETVFVTKATAKGLFFGGRSKENFKDFDKRRDAAGGYRRVNALPVWSHQRGVQYEDGLYVPTRNTPLPDAITGATLTDNFKLLSSLDPVSNFVLKLEINVAFDDNEHYSEFDFPDDEVFHNGTGQLGQPSIVYQAAIDLQDGRDYYLMELVGHGHRSGLNGEVYRDLSTLTTALEMVERIVVGVHQKQNEGLVKE